MNEAKPRHGTDRGSGRRRGSGILAGVAAVLFAAMSLRAGVKGFAEDLRRAFRDAPRYAIPPEIQEQARALKRALQPGEAVLYLGNRKPPDIWYSRLWQKAFYPVPVIIVERENRAVVIRGDTPPPRPTLEELRRSFLIRHAISAGDPPEDPGYVSHVALPRTPGYPYDLWFGLLRP